MDGVLECGVAWRCHLGSMRGDAMQISTSSEHMREFLSPFLNTTYPTIYSSGKYEQVAHCILSKETVQNSWWKELKYHDLGAPVLNNFDPYEVRLCFKTLVIGPRLFSLLQLLLSRETTRSLL